MATYAWKGVQDGKYATGRIEGINRDEAAFKVKQQKVIITSLTRLSGVEQKGDDEKGKKSISNFVGMAIIGLLSIGISLCKTGYRLPLMTSQFRNFTMS